jgi:hypothetical protein
MDDDKPGAVLVLVLVLFFVGLVAGGMLANSKWKADAVKRGYAEYSNTSGAWQWIEKGGK